MRMPVFAHHSGRGAPRSYSAYPRVAPPPAALRSQGVVRMPENRHRVPVQTCSAKTNGTPGPHSRSAGFLGGLGRSPLSAMAYRMEGFLGGWLEDGVSRV